MSRAEEKRGYVPYVAFLRAVNLGRTRKLPMAQVRRVLPDRLGYAPVTTHIASGNVLFGVPADAAAPDEGTDAAATRHAAAIAEVLGELAGFDVPTVVLTPAALAQVLAEQPYDPAEAKHVNVGLVQGVIPADPASGPDAEPSNDLRRRIAAIADRAVADEGIAVGSRAIYLHVPYSIHASKLASAYGRAAPEATARNLATVRTMAERLASF